MTPIVHADEIYSREVTIPCLVGFVFLGGSFVK